MPRIPAVLAAMLLAAGACTGPGDPLPTDPSVRTEVPLRRLVPDGRPYLFYSGVREPGHEVIRDAGAWAAAWARIHAPMHPAPELPAVDFEQEMVIVAALGERPSGGYSIMIDRLREGDGGIEALVVRTAPGSRCGVTAALTAPVDLVITARAAGDLSVSATDEVRECQPDD